jgi:hypothetical protein
MPFFFGLREVAALARREGRVELRSGSAGFFRLAVSLISFRRMHSPSALPPFPRHAPEAPLCSRWHARVLPPSMPSPPSARPRPWCAQHPAHSPTRLCDASKKFQAKQPAPRRISAMRAAPPPFFCSLSCTGTPASVARVRAVCSRGRSFLRPLPRWVFGDPLSQKNDASKNCQGRAYGLRV